MCELYYSLERRCMSCLALLVRPSSRRVQHFVILIDPSRGVQSVTTICGIFSEGMPFHLHPPFTRLATTLSPLLCVPKRFSPSHRAPPLLMTRLRLTRCLTLACTTTAQTLRLRSTSTTQQQWQHCRQQRRCGVLPHDRLAVLLGKGKKCDP